MAPATWGNPHLSLKPCTVVLKSASEGVLMYSGFRIVFMAVTTSWVMRQQVDVPTPKRWEIDLYSRLVVSLHRQIAK